MLKRILQCLAVCAAAAPIAALQATDRCPPLPVAINTCECKVANYGTNTDTGVLITVYDSAGPVASCGPFDIPSKGNEFCDFFFDVAENCGCQVSGEAGASRTSLSVYDPGFGINANASVECY